MELHSIQLHSKEFAFKRIYIQGNLHSMELHSIPKRFFLNLKGLFDVSVVSLTKKEYSSGVYFLYILAKSFVLMSDEWFIAIC